MQDVTTRRAPTSRGRDALLVLLGSLRHQVAQAVNDAPLGLGLWPERLDRVVEPRRPVADDHQRAAQPTRSEPSTEREPVLLRLAHPMADVDQDALEVSVDARRKARSPCRLRAWRAGRSRRESARDELDPGEIALAEGRVALL
jgi:hypothetical protein